MIEAIQSIQNNIRFYREFAPDPDLHHLLNKLNNLLTSQLDQLMIVLNMPNPQQPSQSLSHAERVNAFIQWAETTIGLSKLHEELAQLN